MGAGSWTTGDCELRRGRRERAELRDTMLDYTTVMVLVLVGSLIMLERYAKRAV